MFIGLLLLLLLLYIMLQQTLQALPKMFGGWDWLEHIMESIDANKGMIVKNILIDKYLDYIVATVPGGALMKLILGPFLTEYARGIDRKRQYQYRQKFKNLLIKEEKQRQKKMKQQGKQINTTNLKNAILKQFQQKYIEAKTKIVDKMAQIKAKVDQKVQQKRKSTSQQSMARAQKQIKRLMAQIEELKKKEKKLNEQIPITQIIAIQNQQKNLAIEPKKSVKVEESRKSIHRPPSLPAIIEKIQRKSERKQPIELNSAIELNSVEVPKRNSVEAPKRNSGEAPKRNSGEAPKRNSGEGLQNRKSGHFNNI